MCVWVCAACGAWYVVCGVGVCEYACVCACVCVCVCGAGVRVSFGSGFGLGFGFGFDFGCHYCFVDRNF